MVRWPDRSNFSVKGTWWLTFGACKKVPKGVSDYEKKKLYSLMKPDCIFSGKVKYYTLRKPLTAYHVTSYTTSMKHSGGGTVQWSPGAEPRIR